MPVYRSLGSIPPKRHIRFPVEKEQSFLGEGIAYEHVVTTAGFSRAYSILYHKRPPTRCRGVEYEQSISLEPAEGLPLQPHLPQRFLRHREWEFLHEQMIHFSFE